MRFIHTADWHLGRQFHGASLLDDQRAVLEQLLKVARERSVDAVLIAGDVYDRAVPPADAVALLDEFLQEMVLGAGISVVMIAGNHDSPARLGFASGLLADRGLHIAGPLEYPPRAITLQPASGPVHVVPVPFADPPNTRAVSGRDDLHTHDAALAALIGAAAAGIPPDRRSILMAHCFVSGGAESESERPLSVGGAGDIALARFSGFNYVALGHLHAPQALSSTVHYSGSLMKYSFSEIPHRKSVNLVEMGSDGRCAIEQLALPAPRDVRRIEGHLAELLTAGKDANVVDYLLIRLHDSGALYDAMGRLREVYPNVLHIERPALQQAGGAPGAGHEQLGRGEKDLFASFFEQVSGLPADEPRMAAFSRVVDALRRREREAP